MPKPVKCQCGKPAYAFMAPPSGYEFFVACGTGEYCWRAPWRKTESAAILAWNKVMGKKVQP
jgi:hypothetical protein